MFRIDLFNGKELPPRSHPLRIAAGTLALLAVAVAAAFDGVHAYDLAGKLAGQRQALAQADRQVAGLADVAKMLATAEKRQTEIDATLAEVEQVAAGHAAWSPILVTLVERTPAELSLSEVLAKREESRNASEKGRYYYSLLLGVVSPEGAVPVEHYMQALRAALPLQPGPESVQVISQRHQEIDGLDAQYYIIECKLKP